MKIKRISLLKDKHLDETTMIETLKYMGVECFCSDLARITGVEYDHTNGFGSYWFDGNPEPHKKKKLIHYINSTGKCTHTTVGNIAAGVRIAIPFSDIENFNLEKINNLICEYPLYTVGEMIEKTLDKLFKTNSKLLFKTGRYHDINNIKYEEYEALGIRFIKMPLDNSNKVLTDGTVTNNKQNIYLKIEPIPFNVDEKAQLIYSNIILMRSEFDTEGKYFKDSNLNQYLNTSFLQSINDELEHTAPCCAFDKQTTTINNRYNFDFSSLTEEEIIEICINSNVAVFLHGKTGTGKTERMLTLDRNLELVDFGCTSSDGFTGIIAKDFNSKELFIYEPYWYKNLCKKCQEEPELLHILFLEELTNAKNDIQKVAFEVTLNKTLTNSGFRLQLPENAVVCAAGNEANESRSANAMSEPLFGRFAHVYIDTDSEEWLKWALKRTKEGKKLTHQKFQEPNTIHPAIVDYIKINGDKVLRTPYDGKTPNADPRKWAMASKALYQSNNPNVLRAFVGETITKDFIQFSQMNLITVDDILNDRYDASSIPLDASLKWYTTICLCSVGDENVDKVRDFIKGLGKEFLALFDYEWSKDNEQRIIKLYGEAQSNYVKKLLPNENK